MNLKGPGRWYDLIGGGNCRKSRWYNSEQDLLFEIEKILIFNYSSSFLFS